ncbi:MAG: hypothetical protein U0Q18_30850 [Bryobacteraceae bacterium]
MSQESTISGLYWRPAHDSRMSLRREADDRTEYGPGEHDLK